jgi:hypothetical protein
MIQMQVLMQQLPKEKNFFIKIICWFNLKMSTLMVDCRRNITALFHRGKSNFE